MSHKCSESIWKILETPGEGRENEEDEASGNALPDSGWKTLAIQCGEAPTKAVG